MTADVFFPEYGKSIEMEEGQTVLEAIRKGGFEAESVCGGHGTCGKCRVNVNGIEVLACQTKVTGTIVVQGVKPMEGAKRAEKAAVSADFGPLYAAVDLGTTTIVAYLLSGVTREKIAIRSAENPQRTYGADVIARCDYALEHEDGAEKLAVLAQNAVDRLLCELAEEVGRKEEEIRCVVMAGNPCMHHLFLGIPTDTLAMAPYTPKITEALVLRAREYGLGVSEQASLEWFPNVGGFVGGDTVGAMLAAGLETEEKLTLLIDIGTNGEIVLGDKDGYLACAAAAGPAFEGAKIKCGMRAKEGAITHAKLINEEIDLTVMGGSEIRGICGSGLVDLTACLLEMGEIAASGRMKEKHFFAEDVYLEQNDIRELQLAKAAIAAGVRILCEKRGCEETDIEQVLIAGAFGSNLNPKSVCRIGLLPAKLEPKIRMIGNAAGEGACMNAIDPSTLARSKELTSKTTYIELSGDPGFLDVFIERMHF